MSNEGRPGAAAAVKYGEHFPCIRAGCGKILQGEMEPGYLHPASDKGAVAEYEPCVKRGLVGPGSGE